MPRIEMNDDRIVVDRKLAIPAMIVGIIVVMALTVMTVQYLPFMTRQEASADKEVVMQRIAHDELNQANDEQRIQKLEDHYTDIQMQLAAIDTNLAKLSQQVTDNETHAARGH